MLRKTPGLIMAFLTIIVLSGAFSIVGRLNAQKAAQQPAKESYTRPQPTKPIVPTVPDANKYQEDKVFLERADSLFRPGQEFEEKQVVKGNVVFRQGGMWMYCDSAYYFPQLNSLDAFGHVRMEQGDTLFVYADRLVYDGASKHAVLVDGPSQADVIMKDPKVTLTTDSLDYDMVEDLGWYAVGGKLDDGVNTLTSQYGQYSPTTKIAEFRDNVVLVNNDDGYRMFTEALQYDTRTSIADINTATRIEGANDTIITTSGWYDTRTDNAHLTSRSTILHRDSADNVITLEGDSIIYDKLRHISEAFMFRDPMRRPMPMVLTDTARKMTLIGGYGMYNDSLQESLASYYPMLMEYSRPDTLFLRSDTIRTYQRTEKVWPDSLAHEWNAATRARLRAFTGPLEIADSMPLRLQLLPRGFDKAEFPLLGFTPEWITESQKRVERALNEAAARQKAQETVVKEEETAVIADNEEKGVDALAALIRHRDEIASADTISESEEMPEDSPEDLPEDLPGHLPAPMERLEALLPAVDSVGHDSVVRPRLDRLGRDSVHMVDRNFHVAKAIGKARFFNADMQGIADTIIYQQYDSLLFLLRKPIVWSGERQVSGDTIKVHFVDSVADWAYLPSGGLVIEHVEEEFYNQLSGDEIRAILKNNELDKLFVSGSVETIMLPMENDSTYANIVYSSGSYLTVDVDGKDLKRLTMWPDVEGTVTPIFLATKKEDKYLDKFIDKKLNTIKWYEMLRPRREWYGGRIVWADDLGEVPDELVQYFTEQ